MPFPYGSKNFAVPDFAPELAGLSSDSRCWKPGPLSIQSFRKALSTCYVDATLRINSPGGSMFQASGILNVIVEYRKDAARW